MRGFPLLSTLLVMGILALLRGPLYRTIAVGDSIDHAMLDEEHASGEVFSDDRTLSSAVMKVMATAGILEVRVEHRGKVILEKVGDFSIEEALPEMAVTPGEIEFWVEAKFLEKDQRVALSLDIETDTGEVWSGTLWGEEGLITDVVTLRPR